MRKSKGRIPDEVLKEIFPKKLKRSLASEGVYAQLKKMILSGKLKRGQRLLQDGIAQDFSVSKMAVTIAFSRLKKDRLVICKSGAGSFVA
jgi:DNA-binding GntR family transcriptional regulator